MPQANRANPPCGLHVPSAGTGGAQSRHIFIQEDGGHGGIARDAQFRHRDARIRNDAPQKTDHLAGGLLYSNFNLEKMINTIFFRKRAVWYTSLPMPGIWVFSYF